MFYFDPLWLLFISPAVLLGIWAQIRIRSTYAETSQMPAMMSGARAAREVLDGAGLTNVGIEQVPGHLSDHYDPRDKVLRLSPEVFNGHSLASVGIAAHEAGHAIQDARNYAPLGIRNAAVPIANFGSGFGMILLVIGLIADIGVLTLAGMVLFGGVVFFQLVNLPVEFNASTRAKEQLVGLGIIDQQGLVQVKRVLNAAALTYVAATLQSVMQLLYFVLRFSQQRN